MNDRYITLAHGAGAKRTQALIAEVFQPHLRLPSLDDAASVGRGLMLTTDAFVVRPLFFPGGDIGKLSVCGVVNDLAAQGARPRWLTASFIIEEGLPINTLRRIAASMGETARACSAQIVAGDTKVVERGRGDGVYISVAGVGTTIPGVQLGAQHIQSGDMVIVSGMLGDHAIAIANARENLGVEPPPRSDCAPLHELVETLLQTQGAVFLRDPTRGGLATVCNEIAAETGLGVILDEEALPVRPVTAHICEMLGLDPLYLANEGKMVAICRPPADDALQALYSHPLGRDAAIVGHVSSEHTGVWAQTAIDGLRSLPLLDADMLPRIC